MTSPYRNPWQDNPWVRSVADPKVAARRRMMLSVTVASSGAIAVVVMAMVACAGQGF